MRIHLNFTKHQSLGNVYNNNPIDNFQKFESAKNVYSNHKINIDASIKETLSGSGGEIISGTEITIPTGHYQNSEFVNNLIFIVDEINSGNVHLSLIKVGLKTNH